MNKMVSKREFWSVIALWIGLSFACGYLASAAESTTLVDGSDFLKVPHVIDESSWKDMYDPVYVNGIPLTPSQAWFLGFGNENVTERIEW